MLKKAFGTVFSGLGVMVPFFWVGAISAISFMEAWLKFRAPGMTLSIGLGVGKLVFSALNKVEWGCAALLFASILMQKRSLLQYVLFTIVLLILFTQTFFLFPILFHRIALVQQGGALPPSLVHLVYILLECIKAGSLVGLGILKAGKFKEVVSPEPMAR